MADFEYQDQAMPVSRFKFGDDPSAYKASSEGPAIQQEPTIQSPFDRMSDVEFSNFFMDSYHDEFKYQETLGKVERFNTRFYDQTKKYEDQAWWKKIAAQTKSLQDLFAMSPIGAPLATYKQYKMFDRWDEEGPAKTPEEVKGRQEEMQTIAGGVALISEFHKDLDIHQDPSFLSSKAGDFDFNQAIDSGLKNLEATMRQTSRAAREWILEKPSMTDPYKKFSDYVSPQALDAFKIGDAYVSALLGPTEVYQDKLYLMGFAEKILNGFVEMGPQIAGQVAATAVAGPVGGTMFMFPQIFGSKYGISRDKGASPDQALMAGLLDAALQLPMEALGMGVILRGVPKKWIANKTMKFFVDKAVGGMTEAATEYIQTFPDQFTEAMGDPEWVAKFQAADKEGRWEMIEARAREAAKGGVEEAIIGGLWGMVLGGGNSNIEIARRFGKQIDKNLREAAGKAISSDILEEAGKAAKDQPIEIKRSVDAQDVLDNAVRIVEETRAVTVEAQRQEAMPIGREIPTPAGMEEAPAEVVPIEPEVAEEITPAPVEEAPALGLPEEIEALKETSPEAYRLYIDAMEIQEAEEAKEAPTPKAKKAPVSKPESALSSIDKIERLWNRLDDKQKAKVQDLYDNVIEPMPHIERYQMMQAALSDQDLKLLERPTLTQWRNVPSVRPKKYGKKLYYTGLRGQGRVAKSLNMGIDAGYQLEYGEKAYQQELELAESREVERKVEKKPIAPEKAKKPEEKAAVKPQVAKRATEAKKLFDSFVINISAPGAPGTISNVDPSKIKQVTDLTVEQRLVAELREKLGLGPVAYYTSTEMLLKTSNGYYMTNGGVMLNADSKQGALLSIYGHESWHEIQQKHPALAKAVEDLFWKGVNETEWKRYQVNMNKARENVGLKPFTKTPGKDWSKKEKDENKEGYEKMKQEFVSDYVSSKMTDRIFLQKLIADLNVKNPSLALRLLDILRNLLSMIKGMAMQGEAYVYLRKDFENIEDALIGAYSEIAEKHLEAARISPTAIDSIGIGMQASINMQEPEAIRTPATRHIETGKIYEGVMHSFAWEEMSKDLGYEPKILDAEDGYITTHDRFVDRDDGNAIAIAAEQVSKERERGWLISEDLMKDISDTYIINETGQVQIMVNAAADDAALGMIDALSKGHNTLYVNEGEFGTIAESLGYELTGPSKGRVYGNYEYKGEIYEPNIIAGRFAAAWNKDLAADGRTAKLLDTISQQYAESARLVLDTKKQKQIEKELDGYLKRSWKSYADGEKLTASGSAILPTKNVRVKGGKSTMAMVQVSSLRGREETTSQGDAYFDLLYSERDGYERPIDFWEVPTWMAQGAKSFKNSDTYVVRNIEEAKAYFKASDYESIMFSAMDANKHFIKELAGSFDGDIIVGGYVDPKYFEGIKNIKFAEDMESAAKLLKVPYKKGEDYRQFKGTRVIPRLEMSKGCKHKCHFCTVPKKVIPNKDFMADAKSFASLGFKLVYLNDKTFGQADNFADLVEVNKQIKSENPDFQGFVIQTTAPAFNKLSDDFLTKSGIKYVELGMESYNDDILAKINKPHRTKHIDEAVEKMRRLKISFIPNVMVGLAGMEKGELWTETAETYRNTLNYLEANKDIISHTNTYILATYEGTETGSQLGTDNEVDGDENVVKKSWLQNQDMHEMFYRRVLEFSSKQLKAPDLQASILMATKEDPVILPQDLREAALSEDYDFNFMEEDPYGAIKYLHILDLKLRAYDAIPDDKLDSFAKHYQVETNKEFVMVANRTLDFMKGVYDEWLYRHESPETWFDSQFSDEYIEEHGLKASELFTAGKIGWIKMGQTWEFDVSKDIESAVQEEHEPPHIPEDENELVRTLINKYGHERVDLQEESEDNLWKMWDFEVQMDKEYTVYTEMNLDTIAEYLDDNGLKSPVGETVRRVMIEKGYPAWKDNFPSMDAAEERIRDQRKRMEDAKTDKETMTAISLAMNEQHVFGTMAEHMNVAKNELEELGNIAEGIYRFEDMLRRQYKPDVGVENAQLQQSIDLEAALKGTDIKVKVAGKSYTINEQRSSIEKLLELTGGAKGLRKFLTDNGVDKLLAGRIQTIGKSMEEYPFPTVQETVKDLLAMDKKDPKVKHWYDDIKYLRTVFENDDDLNLFMGLAMLSHTSRNKGTLANMVEFIKFRMLEKAGQIDRTTKFGLVDAKTVGRVLNAKNIDEMFRIDFTALKFKGGEVKVKAFAETFASILRDPSVRSSVESVVDIWVNRYFYPSASAGPLATEAKDKALSQVQHLRVQRHMRDVEAEMSKKTGDTWHPDMAQAVLWFHIRDIWEKARGKVGQEGYTFDETLNVMAERWSGAIDLDDRQVEAYIKLKLRDGTVRHVLDTYSQDKDLNVFDMVKGEDPLLIQFFDAAKLPKDYDISGKTRHRAVIDTDKIYNADLDPDGLIDPAFDPEDITTLLSFEKKIRDAGWVGLKSGDMTILLEPTRVEPMRRGSLGISNIVAPDILEVIKNNFPQHYRKLVRYQKWYDEGKTENLDNAMRSEVTRLFTHPLIDIRSIGPAEGRWFGGRQFSIDIDFDYANVDIAKGVLAQFLKDNAQYEGVFSEQVSGWNDKHRPEGVAGDQAPSIVLKFKDSLTEDQLVELSALLDNNGINGSTYTPSINSLTLHHIKYRNNEKAVEPAIKYNDNIIRGAKNYEALYKKSGITFKQLREAAGEKGFFTNKGRFVNNVKAKELKDVFGTVKQNDSDFLQAALDSIQAIQREFPSFEGFGQVWYNHSVLSNDWKVNPKGQGYDKKIAKATKVSRDLGLIAEPKIVTGEFRKGAKLFEEQGRPRLGAVERLNPNAIKGIKEFVKKEPIKGLIDVNQAALYQQWLNAGINIGPIRDKQLKDFREGKQRPVPGKQEALFASIPMNQKEAYAASEAYSKAPNNLLGFSKDPFIQKGFYDQNYSFTARVEITFPRVGATPGQTFTDEIRGLNKPHALERARRNWDGARVQYLDGFRNNERKQKVFASIVVYHGTGAEYAQYDLDYMSTGEGFQAFAWGEYFAGKLGLGKKYARVAEKGAKLSGFSIELPGETLEVVKGGKWIYPGFYKININDDGTLRGVIGPDGDTSIPEYARYKVLMFLESEVGKLLSETREADGQINSEEAMRFISDALYDMIGFASNANMRLRDNEIETGKKGVVVTVPGLGRVNEELVDAVYSELNAWEIAIEEDKAVVTTEGGIKIVHKVELSEDLVLADWFKAIDKKLMSKIINKLEGSIDKNIDNEASGFTTLKYRLENNPTTPLFKHVYGELTSFLGSKKNASVFLETVGIDGIRFEADTMFGKTPNSVLFESDRLLEELNRVRPTLPDRLRDTHFAMSKVMDHDPEFVDALKEHIDPELIDNLHRAIEDEWSKNYVIFHKVEDTNYVQIKEQIYLSLDAFRVQERGAVQYLNTKIGRSDASMSEKLAETFGYFTGKGKDRSNWRYLMFDKLDPIAQWFGAESHAYMKARGVPGAVGSLAAFLEHGKLYWDNTMTIQVMKDPKTKKVMRKAGFLPWIKKLGPNDGVKFFYWLIAKRAEALDVEGREHWLKKEDREKILAWVGLPENKEGLSWEQINEQFQEFNKNILDIATKAGVIGKESRETWESDLYIPFYRVIENQVTAAEFWRTPPRSKDFLSAGIKRLTGGEAKIGDPMENIMKNWTHLLNTSITNVARASGVKYATDNKVLTGLTRLIKAKEYSVLNPSSGAVLDVFDTMKEAKEYIRDEITSNDLWKKKDIQIDYHEYDVEIPIPVIEEVPWSQTVVMKAQKDKAGKPTGAIYVHKKSGEQLLSYQKAGKMQYFKVNDPELYVSMSGMNPHQFNNAVMAFFRGTKKWLTYGATFGPGFRIANAIRDTLHTTLISKSFIPFFDTMRGFWKAWGETEAYVGYLASGHAFGGHYVRSEDPKALANYIKTQLKGQNVADKFINHLMGSEGKTIIGRILDTPAKMLKLWERVGAASENAARIQLAENLMAKGETTEKAYFASRDLMDFQMSGAAGIVQFMIQTIPFLNARAQGLYKMGRAARENPTHFAMKAFAISLASLGLWLMYKDDDRYKELEDWDRFAYYHFWIGDLHFRIPKPFETGVLFSTSVEAVGNVMVGNEEVDHLWTYLKHATTETFAFNPILGIQATKPLAEQWANKVSFTGRPIEGQGLSGLRWGDRYDPWTSETMRLIGGTLNLPPKRMEHLIRGYTGTFGMFILGMSDAFTRNAFDFPERPDLSWNEYPGFARFIKKGEARNTKYMTRFYDHYKQMSELVRSVNYYDKLGDFKTSQKLIRDNKEFYSLKKQFNKARKEMGDINREIRLVWLNPRMDGAEKKRRLEVLYQRRNKIVRNIYAKYKKEN